MVVCMFDCLLSGDGDSRRSVSRKKEVNFDISLSFGVHPGSFDGAPVESSFFIYHIMLKQLQGLVQSFKVTQLTSLVLKLAFSFFDFSNFC